MIAADSVEILKSELDTVQGGHAGVDMSASDGLAEHLQGLQATVQAQTDQIARLTEKVEELSGQLEHAIKALPPARAEDLEEPEEPRQSAWWRRLLRL